METIKKYLWQIIAVIVLIILIFRKELLGLYQKIKTSVLGSPYMEIKPLPIVNRLADFVKSQRGVKEFDGKPSNSVIDKWFQRLGYNSLGDETPWCGAFVGYSLLHLGYVIASIPLRARDYENCLGDDLPENNGDYNLMNAKPYHTVVVSWRNSETAGTGHVGFFVREEGNYIILCGGNQNDEVNDSYRLPKARVTRVFNPVKEPTLV